MMIIQIVCTIFELKDKWVMLVHKSLFTKVFGIDLTLKLGSVNFGCLTLMKLVWQL